MQDIITKNDHMCILVAAMVGTAATARRAWRNPWTLTKNLQTHYKLIVVIPAQIANID